MEEEQVLYTSFKILLAVALLNIVSVTMVKANPYDQPDKSFFNQKDKQLHIGFSIPIAMAGNALCYQQFGLTKGQSWWCGLGTALLIGGFKEVVLDTNGDWEDMGANAIGGVIGTTGMWTIYKFQSGK